MAVVGRGFRTPSQLQYRDVAHTIVSERSVVVNYEVTTAPGTPITCRRSSVECLLWNRRVARRRHPALGSVDKGFETPLRTSEPAVTGLLYECWLT